MFLTQVAFANLLPSYVSHPLRSVCRRFSFSEAGGSFAKRSVSSDDINTLLAQNVFCKSIYYYCMALYRPM